MYGFKHRIRHCVLRTGQDDPRAPMSTRCSQRKCLAIIQFWWSRWVSWWTWCNDDRCIRGSLFCERCSCAISREIGKDLFTSHDHFTLDSFPVDAGRRVRSAGGLRPRRVSLEAVVFGEALPEELQKVGDHFPWPRSTRPPQGHPDQSE